MVVVERASETALVKYSQQVCCVKAASLVNTVKKRKKRNRTAVVLLLKRGQEKSDWLCSRREKREKKQGEEREQPTCYHTVFNNSVAATRGLHVHATAVQCLLGVCATHKRAPIQKSSHSALSVSYRQREAEAVEDLCLWTHVYLPRESALRRLFISLHP